MNDTPTIFHNILYKEAKVTTVIDFYQKENTRFLTSIMMLLAKKEF